MAITQTGTVLEFSGGTTNSGTVSSTITVPADAQVVMAGWSSYKGSANFFSGGSMTCTKGGVDTAMTAVTGGDNSTAMWQGALFYQVLPDTGSNKTVKFDWVGTATPDENTLCSITFWTGVNVAGAVRDSDGAQGNSLPITTPTLTASSGDLIVAWAGLYGGGSNGTVNSWTNASTLSQVTNVGSCDGAWATGSPSGNTTVAIATTTSLTEGAILAVVLIPAAAVKVPLFQHHYKAMAST